MDPKEQVAYLRSPRAIREQCVRLTAMIEADQSPHFRLVPERMAMAASRTVRLIKARYPDLKIPYHSRWRHFAATSLELLNEKLAPLSHEEAARCRIELAVVSVLLDAGAGERWQFKTKDGQVLSRSEGLAAASLEMFLDGGFSSDPDAPLQADVMGLKAIGKRELAAYCQTSAENPLAGFDGRLNLLHKLAQAVQSHGKIFGHPAPRLGQLFDYLDSQAGNGKIAARRVLSAILESLSGIWPGRVSLAGSHLGDVWRHQSLPADDLGAGLVPFHKLSQWLTYSLVEPLEEAGLEVTGLDDLTGLAEYRNGGLLIDLGVLVPKDRELLAKPLKPDHEAVIEWRAATIVALDHIAELVRRELGRSNLELPLAKILEGGTWAAGREIAAEKRPGGGPPIQLASDGTVF